MQQFCKDVGVKMAVCLLVQQTVNKCKVEAKTSFTDCIKVGRWCRTGDRGQRNTEHSRSLFTGVGLSKGARSPRRARSGAGRADQPCSGASNTINKSSRWRQQTIDGIKQQPSIPTVTALQLARLRRLEEES